MKRSSIIIFVVLVSFWGTSSVKANELPACGGIYLNGGIQCELSEQEECMPHCVAVAMERSCAAQLYTECESSCTATASAQCESDCTQVCINDCDVPALPSCTDLCEADCDASCRGQCAGDGPCDACCTHQCNAKCEHRCDGVAPAEACDLKCQAACTGSCTAQANTQCQVDCQTAQYAACEQETMERCTNECETTGVAIFCNGQFVSTDDFDACVAQLADEIDVHLDADVEGNVYGKALCAVANVGVAPSGGAGSMCFATLPLLALLRLPRRRRDRRHVSTSTDQARG